MSGVSTRRPWSSCSSMSVDVDVATSTVVVDIFIEPKLVIEGEQASSRWKDQDRRPRLGMCLDNYDIPPICVAQQSPVSFGTAAHDAVAVNP